MFENRKIRFLVTFISYKQYLTIKLLSDKNKNLLMTFVNFAFCLTRASLVQVTIFSISRTQSVLSGNLEVNEKTKHYDHTSVACEELLCPSSPLCQVFLTDHLEFEFTSCTSGRPKTNIPLKPLHPAHITL